MSSEGDGASNAPPNGGGETGAPEKDGTAPAPKQVLRTLVGVPLLDDAGKSKLPTADSPSTTQVNDAANGGAPIAGDSGTAVDVKSMSAAEAERVLAWTGFTQEEIPTAFGVAPAGTRAAAVPPAPSTPMPATVPSISARSSRTPEVRPSGEGTVKHVSMPTRGNSAFIEPRGTSRGIAPPPLRTPIGGMKAQSKPPPPPPKSIKPPPPKQSPSMRPMPSKRPTLVMDAGAPTSMDEQPTSTAMDRPPINVPAAGSSQPKAVTQPPPWGEGKVQLGVPKPGGLPRDRVEEESLEEISASVFLPEDEDLEKTRHRGQVVEEMSGSLLLPEDPDDLEKTRLRGPKVEEMSGSILLPDESGAARPVPTRRGHAGLPRAIPKTKESPVHSPHVPAHAPSSIPPPLPARATTSAPPPPVTHSPHPPPAVHAAHVAPSITNVAPRVNETAPYSFEPPPSSNSPGASGPLPAFPLPPESVPAPLVPPAPITAPLPLEPPPAPQVVAPFVQDPSLPPGVPVPEPPPVIVHPAWPPPHIEPPASLRPQPPPPGASQTRSSTPPPVGPPRAMMHSTPPPPGPRLESTDNFIPSLSILRNRPKWFMPAVIGGGVVVSIGLLGLVISIFSGGSDDPKDAHKRASGGAGRNAAMSALTFASTAPTMSAPPTTAPTTTAPTSSTPTAPSTTACTAGGSGHVVAPRAVIAAGVEAVAFDGGVALGFAPSDREGMAVVLDPTSLNATSITKTKTTDTVRRVTPAMSAKRSLYAIADADRKTDKIRGRRYVPGDPSIDVGANGGSLVVTTHNGGGGIKLWTIPGDGAVDAVRGVSFSLDGEKAFAIAFRRGASVFVGVATGDGKSMTAKGPLSKLDGLGDRIGSPAIAASGGNVFVTWADRRVDTDPWSLRYVTFQAGSDAGTPQSYSVPGGGLGANAMSPGITGLAGARFLLVWTEGPVDSHQVRAQTLSANGAALGAALAISADGVNSGQGQAAVGSDGRGVVAFLDGTKREVVATPIVCPM